LRVFGHFSFTNSMTVDLFPCLGVDVGQLVGGNTDNWAIFDMHGMYIKWEITVQERVDIPQAAGSGPEWARV
jgi:hypothetical protein